MKRSLLVLSLLIAAALSSSASSPITPQFSPETDAGLLYTLADGQMSVIIPHRFNVDTGEATDGEVHILKDQGSPPKVKVFPTNNIKKLDPDWRVNWQTAGDVQRGAHLYINPREFPGGAAMMSFELAEAYRRRDALTRGN